MLRPTGHAIECRIYAEDPDNGFLPSPGRIVQLRTPSGPGIRDDGGATAGWNVPVFYDPLISSGRGLGRGSTAGHRSHACGPSTSISSWVSRRLSRSFDGCFKSQDFCSAMFRTTYLDDMLKAPERPAFRSMRRPSRQSWPRLPWQSRRSCRRGSGTVVNSVGDGTSRWRARARAEGLGSQTEALEH